MSFEVPRETYAGAIQEVVIGATAANGGTRGRALTIGGAGAMPFSPFDGAVGRRPVLAMEVFDAMPDKYPPSLREAFDGVLDQPAGMAQRCVEYGADMISLRLHGAHPEMGDASPEACAEAVKSVLAAVDVPVAVTGIAPFEKNNAVMKKVAEVCAGENLLLSWVETENYKTICAAAMAYGHCVVALSPIDINMAKQLNILATGIGLGRDKIVMDPMISALGYGLDYGYTISERVRLAALCGDEHLAFPLMANVGYECSRVKETHVAVDEVPEWGDANERAALWEIVTGGSLLVAGADLLILYHPKAVEVLRAKIDALTGAGKEA